MKERILAARKEEAARAAAKAQPGAAKAQPGAAKTQPGAAKSKPAAAKAKPAAAKAKAAPKPAAAKARPAGAAKAKPAAAKASSRSSRSSTPARSRRGSSRRGGDEEQEGSGSSRRRGSRREKQKRSLVGPMLGLLALIVVCGGAGWFLMNADSEADQPDEVAAADNAEGAEGSSEEALAGEDTGEATAEDSPSEEEPIAESSAAEGSEESASEEVAAEEKPVKEVKKRDPASIDLDAFDDFGPIEGCSEQRFDELNQLVATMVDPQAGAAGNRAKVKLEAAGKESFPSILNAMRRLDLTDEDQFRSGDVCQKTLQNICNGNNFGWKYPSSDPDDFHYFNKVVISNWCKKWIVVKDDDKAWAKLAKLDAVEESPAEAAAAEDELEDDLDDLDDL